MPILERRREPRQPIFASGKIGYGGRAFRISCLVQNISSSGAKLVLHTRTDLPSEFSLRISDEMASDRMRIRWQRTPVDLEREYAVQTRWRKGNALGVKFKT
jgi:PilZ domain